MSKLFVCVVLVFACLSCTGEASNVDELDNELAKFIKEIQKILIVVAGYKLSDWGGEGAFKNEYSKTVKEFYGENEQNEQNLKAFVITSFFEQEEIWQKKSGLIRALPSINGGPKRKMVEWLEKEPDSYAGGYSGNIFRSLRHRCRSERPKEFSEYAMNTLENFIAFLHSGREILHKHLSNNTPEKIKFLIPRGRLLQNKNLCDVAKTMGYTRPPPVRRVPERVQGSGSVSDNSPFGFVGSVGGSKSH